jgi:hypothetical protein
MPCPRRGNYPTFRIQWVFSSKPDNDSHVKPDTQGQIKPDTCSPSRTASKVSELSRLKKAFDIVSSRASRSIEHSHHRRRPIA